MSSWLYRCTHLTTFYCPIWMSHFSRHCAYHYHYHFLLFQETNVWGTTLQPPPPSINNYPIYLLISIHWSQGKPKMAKASVSNFASFFSLLLISSLVFASHFVVSEAQTKPPAVKGLSYSFFDKTCPKLETIVRSHLKEVFDQDNGQAPGLLRIFFHDCFVQVIIS